MPFTGRLQVVKQLVPCLPRVSTLTGSGEGPDRVLGVPCPRLLRRSSSRRIGASGIGCTPSCPDPGRCPRGASARRAGPVSYQVPRARAALTDRRLSMTEAPRVRMLIEPHPSTCTTLRACGIAFTSPAAVPVMEDLLTVNQQHTHLSVLEGREALVIERLWARKRGGQLHQSRGASPVACHHGRARAARARQRRAAGLVPVLDAGRLYALHADRSRADPPDPRRRPGPGRT